MCRIIFCLAQLPFLETPPRHCFTFLWQQMTSTSSPTFHSTFSCSQFFSANRRAARERHLWVPYQSFVGVGLHGRMPPLSPTRQIYLGCFYICFLYKCYLPEPSYLLKSVPPGEVCPSWSRCIFAYPGAGCREIYALYKAHYPSWCKCKNSTFLFLLHYGTAPTAPGCHSLCDCSSLACISYHNFIGEFAWTGSLLLLVLKVSQLPQIVYTLLPLVGIGSLGIWHILLLLLHLLLPILSDLSWERSFWFLLRAPCLSLYSFFSLSLCTSQPSL